MNLLYDAEAAKLVVMDLVREAGVQTLLHSYAYETLTQDSRVVGVELCNKGGTETVLADVVVDATADADVVARAGFDVRKGQGEEGTLFAMTMLVRLGNIDWPAISQYSESDPGFDRAIAEAIDRGELPYYRPRTREMVNYTGHATPELSHLVRPKDALLWGGTVEGVDGTSAEDLTRAEFECRDQFRSELAFLKKRIPGFSDATIEATGHQVGVRDTRHIVGLFTMTPADILEQRRYHDVVAYNVKGASPVNDIRYGCLVPAHSQGVLVCGNGISVLPGSTQMGITLGSYNNIKDIPSMWTTGEAAGVAAALCCAGGTSPAEVDVGEVQQRLKTVGALIDDKERRRRMEQELPTGRRVAQFYQEQLDGMISYWEERGQYERPRRSDTRLEN
jgi:hypothetical protein